MIITLTTTVKGHNNVVTVVATWVEVFSLVRLAKDFNGLRTKLVITNNTFTITCSHFKGNGGITEHLGLWDSSSDKLQVASSWIQVTHGT